MTEAALLCKKRGQALWPSSAAKPNLSEVNTFVERHAQELEEDFKSVLDKMGISISRIDKDISVLTALVAISGGRQALQENRGVSFLVLLATIFLPSSTVATVLGIQTEYGPGAEHFWLLWALALPLTVLVIVMPLLYSGVREIFNLTSWKSFPVKRDRTSDRPRDLQGGGIEMSDTPVPLNDQMLRGSMV
ncbi:hypothetical protein DL95DRAFT_398420 [Leptodontidium sp. 2 PMI_412]|nr:hypothetical protein DL95DRAFT_398420 [Leptodontidium sp. 2 PMI_412]